MNNAQTGSNKVRTNSMNGSLDGFKNGPRSIDNSTNQGQTIAISNQSQLATPVSKLTTENQNSSDYMKLKQSAEQFHARGYDARKKGDYLTAIE